MLVGFLIISKLWFFIQGDHYSQYFLNSISDMLDYSNHYEYKVI